MHEAAGQDPVPVLHPGDELTEAAITDLAGQPLQGRSLIVNVLARRQLGSRGGVGVRDQLLLEVEIRVHGASIGRLVRTGKGYEVDRQ